MTNPDPDTYTRLEDALEAHQGDTEAYGRLGRLFRTRRRQLPPRYAGDRNRNRLARERLAPLLASANPERAAMQLLYELETGTVIGQRKGFSAAYMLLFARTYQVTPESVADALDGGELIPAGEPQTAAAQAPAAPPRTGRPGDGDFPLPPDTEREFGADMRPHEQVITASAEVAARAYGVDLGEPGARLEGGWVFPHDVHAARAWDNLTSRGMSARSVIRWMALWRVFDAMEDQEQQPGGRDAAGLPQAGLKHGGTPGS